MIRTATYYIAVSAALALVATIVVNNWASAHHHKEMRLHPTTHFSTRIA